MSNFSKWLLLVVVSATSLGAQIAKPIVRAVNSPTSSATASGASVAPVITPDGRYVAFCSNAKDLVPGQSNTLNLDVFLRDIDEGTTVPISVTPSGSVAGNGNSGYPAMSANCQFIAFISAASNLTSQTGGSYPELFIRDTVANTTHMESLDAAGNPGASGSVSDCDITPDGRYLLIVSSQFLTSESFGTTYSQVYLRDRLVQTNTLVTVSTNTTRRSSGVVDCAGISSNGRWIVYTSTAPDLIGWPGGSLGKAHAYVFDASTQTNACLSIDARTVIGVMPQTSSNVVVSADGSAVAFVAVTNGSFLIYETLSNRQAQIIATNIDLLTPPQLSSDGSQLLFRAAANGATNIYLWNAQTVSTRTVNVALDGLVNGDSAACAMSADGSRVVFVSDATNLTFDVANGLYQIYVRDTISATTRLVSITPAGPAPTSQRHSYPAISGDGSRVVFVSADNTFVVGDNNHQVDVFVWSWATGQVEAVSTRDPSRINDTDVGGIVPTSYIVSSNGQAVAFAAYDGNLAPNDTNTLADLFVRDFTRGATTLVTANTNAALETNWVNFPIPFRPALSADGRFITYAQDYGKAYLRDLQTGSRTLIFAQASPRTAISPDGRYVAYENGDYTFASSLVIFLYDTQTASNIQVTFPPVSTPGAYDPSNEVFTADGQWLVYQSTAAYIAGPSGSTNGLQYYAWNRIGKTNAHISYAPNHTLFSAGCSNAVLTADGNVMAFSSTQSSVPVIVTHNFSNGSNQIVCFNANNPTLNRDGTKMAYNVQLGSSNQIYVQTIGSTTSNLVSVGYDGFSLARSNCSAPILTADGRFVVFTSAATNLVAGDTNGVVDIFVRDLVLSNTFAITGPGSSVPNLGGVNPIVAADGRTIVFQSFSTDFTTNILTANRNLFVAKILVGDSDHDGMDDDWEMAYFGNLSHDGTADTDGDGLTDYQEFLAGTNPIDNSSVLRCLAVATSAGGATVYWAAVPGRAYQIEYKNSIDDPNWATLIRSTTASNQTASVFDSDAGLNTQRFYRVIALP